VQNSRIGVQNGTKWAHNYGIGLNVEVRRGGAASSQPLEINYLKILEEREVVQNSGIGVQNGTGLNVEISNGNCSDSAVEDPNEFPKLVRGGGWRLEILVRNGTKFFQEDGITSIPQSVIEPSCRLFHASPLTLQFEFLWREAGTKFWDRSTKWVQNYGIGWNVEVRNGGAASSQPLQTYYLNIISEGGRVDKIRGQECKMIQKYGMGFNPLP